MSVLLPLAFRRMNEGNVFMPVCPFTEGVPVAVSDPWGWVTPGPVQGVPSCPVTGSVQSPVPGSMQGVPPTSPVTGPVQNPVWGVPQERELPPPSQDKGTP